MIKMKLENGKIITCNGIIGTAIQYTDEKDKGIFRFSSIENKPSWMKSKEEFPIITKKDTIEDADDYQKELWLLSECEWLGQPITAHKIGEYQIVEYKNRETNEHNFTTFINYKSLSHSYNTLDAAIAGCIAYKYEGCNHAADMYFMKMITRKGD